MPISPATTVSTTPTRSSTTSPITFIDSQVPKAKITLSKGVIGPNPNEKIIVYWNLDHSALQEPLHTSQEDIQSEPKNRCLTQDWLGLYVAGESEVSKCLAWVWCHSEEGDTNHGRLTWHLDVPCVVPKNVCSVVIRYHSVVYGEVCLGSSSVIRVSQLSSGGSSCGSGTSGCYEGSASEDSELSEDEVLLQHPHNSFLCCNLIPFTIHNLSARGLRRGMFFQPDPYVKIRVSPGLGLPLLPHHKKEVRTNKVENTVNPTFTK
ncbi:unnamed protein product, partial [Meganyctiphanes norvegica]